MKAFAVACAVVLILSIASMLVPETGAFRWHLTIGALAVGVVLLVSLLLDRRPAAAPPPVRAEAVKPAAVPVAKNQAEAEVVAFLALLQEKGRLVDFAMDDISRYSDAQIGAAARVVHEGCRSVLQQHFAIRPVRDEAEGATVTVPQSHAADEVRLVGRIEGQAPFSGRLVHRGWRTETVKLPRVLRQGDDRLPTIAPAEVELS
jgi:hypothetical protein